MAETLLDKYLREKHIEAGEDFNENKPGEGKKEDDTIGVIHDRLDHIEEFLKQHFAPKNKTENNTENTENTQTESEK